METQDWIFYFLFNITIAVDIIAIIQVLKVT